VEIKRGDPLKPIKVISGLLEKPGTNVHQHVCSLKHLDSSVKGLEEAPDTGYHQGGLIEYAEEPGGLQGDNGGPMEGRAEEIFGRSGCCCMPGIH
jgi:hypothetical protein